MTLADCTVMVVEDHEFQRRTTLQMLANLGVGGLLEAADGDAALALLGEADIIVCDLDMPGMDGVEFLRHVSQSRAGAAIVIACGLDESVLRSAELTAARVRPRRARGDPQAADRPPAPGGGGSAPAARRARAARGAARSGWSSRWPVVGARRCAARRRREVRGATPPQAPAADGRRPARPRPERG